MAVLVLFLTGLLESAIVAPLTAEGAVRESALIGPPETDDWFCSQPFSFENMEVGLGFSQSNFWMMADDYFAGTPYQGNLIKIWAVYSVVLPDDFVVQVRSDNPAGGPGQVFFANEPDQVNHEDTGYSQWGYTLWYTELHLYMQYPAGKNWLAIQALTSTQSYWLAADQQWSDMSYFSSNNGATWISSEQSYGTPCEQFMALSGAPLALERGSWGRIKALFHL